MHAIENAFKYCYHTIGEIFYHPKLFLMLVYFGIESLVITGLALALTTITIYFFNLTFWGLFLIGVVMAFFLLAIYFLYELLKARAIYFRLHSLNNAGQGVKFPALAWAAFGYTLQHLVPWSNTDKPVWKSGKHLVLPLMVNFHQSYKGAINRLNELRSSKLLRVDPRFIKVKPLTLIFCVIAILVGIALGTWLGFSGASGIVVPFIRRVQATGLALLVFLAISWIPLSLSAIKLGLYYADILVLELVDQPETLCSNLSYLFPGMS